MANASDVAAPPILRRGIGYLEVSKTGQVDSGLLFVAFQNSPAEFVRLHDRFLIDPPAGSADGLLTGGVTRPLTADVYFVPDFIGWGYAGQQFFEPERFEGLFEGARLGEIGRFQEAMAIYRETGRQYPDFLPAFSNLSDLGSRPRRVHRRGSDGRRGARSRRRRISGAGGKGLGEATSPASTRRRPTTRGRRSKRRWKI